MRWGRDMHEKFIALDQVKRDKIINVAMQEFARKGFKKASTNEIVQKAEISKGALFHYFSSKWDLFEFLCTYSIDIFSKTTHREIKELPSDLFERHRAILISKCTIIAQYPLIFEFLISVQNDEDARVQKYINDVHEQNSEHLMQEIYSDIDTSKFNPDIGIEKSLQIICWTLEGFVQSKKKTVDFQKIRDADSLKASVEQAIDEINEYLDILKKIFYK